jgi:hypothetical protein
MLRIICDLRESLVRGALNKWKRDTQAKKLYRFVRFVRLGAEGLDGREKRCLRASMGGVEDTLEQHYDLRKKKKHRLILFPPGCRPGGGRDAPEQLARSLPLRGSRKPLPDFRRFFAAIDYGIAMYP